MNKYNPKIHHRKSIRLKGYDYSQAGFYFVTICCQHRACLFGGIVDGAMILNDAGKMVINEWLKLKKRFKNIELQEYVVMPNHFHGIVEIVGATLVVAQNNATTYNVMGNIRKGQPQGIAPTDKTIAHTDKTVDHTDKTVDHTDKTIANTDKTIDHTDKTIANTDKTVDHTDKTVGDMVGAFESITTVEYIRCVKNNHWQPFDGKLWQRNFWEHIIRNENEYRRITQYILENPRKWAMDKLNGGDGNQVMESPVGYNAEVWMT
jgi:REP element-mobilizing transposase RayT